MAFGMQGGESADDIDIMNEINMTPLVDVMLVLLIIFIITVPVMQQAVVLDLPRTHALAPDRKPQVVTLSIDAQGQLFWEQNALDSAELDVRLRQAARQEPQPQLRVRADKSVRYEFVAQAMAQAQRAGLQRIGFLTEALVQQARP